MSKFRFEYDNREDRYAIYHGDEYVGSVGAEYLLDFCGEDYLNPRDAMVRFLGERIVDYFDHNDGTLDRYILKKALIV